MTTEASGQFVQSLARGLRVIKTFDAEHSEMTLSEIALRAGLTRATARRFLLTLLELNYVSIAGRLFSLTPRVLELGFSYLSGLSLPEMIQPHLEQLSRRLDESTSASLLDGEEVVYIARVPTRRIMRVGITIGTRFPAHATSMGRVLLANLPPSELDQFLANRQATAFTTKTVVGTAELRTILDKVRKQGWSIVDQELELGLRSVAAPVHQSGKVVAAINVSTTSTSSTLEQIHDTYRPALLETAVSISEELNLRPR